MARFTSKGSTDDKDNDGQCQKKKKTTPTSGGWPCKINGCNKEFAREADLKRHQRTTRLHSMPSFACPQCPAVFTRPDALRRHQKSRHNGGLTEQHHEQAHQSADDDDDRASSSPSGSRSRSATPSTKGKEREAEVDSIKYYRSRAATYGPSKVSHSHYDQVAIPTSSSRLNNNTPAWPYSQSWPEHAPLPPIGYPLAPTYYTPSPHYRIDGPPPMLHPVSGSAYPRAKPQSQESSSRTTLNHSPTYTSSERTTVDVSATGSPGGIVIDPSLESSDNTNKLSEEQVRALSLEITQAAMRAVIQSTAHESARSNSRKGSPNNRPKLNEGNARTDDASASNLTEELSSQRSEDANVAVTVHCDATQQELRDDAGLFNICDGDVKVEPAERSRGEGPVLSPGSWLSICLS